MAVQTHPSIHLLAHYPEQGQGGWSGGYCWNLSQVPWGTGLGCSLHGTAEEQNKRDNNKKRKAMGAIDRRV